MDKRHRQSTLLRLVRKHAAVNQAALVELLKKAGFSANQASVSRDLRELGIVKARGRYRVAATLRVPRSSPTNDAMHELITNCEPVGANILVVRTKIGAASTVAVEIDRRQLPEVAGTLAGDDTIFLAVKSRSAQGRILALLREIARLP